MPPEPQSLPLYTECLQTLKDFLLADVTNAPGLASSPAAVPVTAPTHHRPSTDIGIDLVGYTFTDRALGQCKVLAPSTYADEDNIVWNTLDFSSSVYTTETQFAKVSEVRAWIKKDKNHRAPSPATSIIRPAPQLLTQGPIPAPPQRAILRAPNMVPPQPIHKYDLRSRRGTASAKRMRRNYRADRRAYAAVLPIPEACIPPALNLDVNGKSLTYRSAKNGPERLLWERAESDELIRLLDSETIVPIRFSDIPENRLGDIFYYNPVVKQKRNDDGSTKFRVQGTAGGDRLTVRTTFPLVLPRLKPSNFNPFCGLQQQEMANTRHRRLLLGHPPAGIPLRIHSHQYQNDPERHHGPLLFIWHGKQLLRLLRNSMMHVWITASRATFTNPPDRTSRPSRLSSMPQHTLPVSASHSRHHVQPCVRDLGIGRLIRA
jgi:hypothetical protein